MSPFNLETCARPNILALQPYRCARDDYKENGTNILLDANENAFGPAVLPCDMSSSPDAPSRPSTLSTSSSSSPSAALSQGSGIDLRGLHRYPDPHQHHLKQLLCNLRNTHAHTPKTITPENLFVGLGSDEAIDALIRCFCVPGQDSILTCPPTYGMYAVSAQVNDVNVLKVPLLPGPAFSLDIPAIMDALSASSSSSAAAAATSADSASASASSSSPTKSPTVKLVYLCSPGNPTGSLLPKPDLHKLLSHPTWNGILILDEAYIDFANPTASLAELTAEYPNLVVLQTLSKAFGMAAIRLGAAFCPGPIAKLLNNMKAPYNVPSPTSALAIQALSPTGLARMRENLAKISVQRDRLLGELEGMEGIGGLRGGRDANFLLCDVLGRGGEPDNGVAGRVYEMLAQEFHVVVRFRGKEPGCEGCLRITVGTEEEVTRLVGALRRALGVVRAGWA
ncbi:hypothetical protein E4U60_006111 [Claviceps pazoutovae]|uniref:histidinol-phosphate transaminase n=1 Tax=Claviceps pazoutovae TaxID=1649127 RepID=A0A9P7M727_9HYPO|nr:hypothetical protein E4U60_006111 [Claviceps pazoutovae]